MTLDVTTFVQAAWTGRQTGIMTIGTSAIGGPDVLGGTFGNNVYDDLTADVKSVSISRGRSRGVLSKMRQATCVARLKDTTGKYNPANAASPLAGLLVPMRPFRVSRSYGTVNYPLFHGYISDIDHNPEKSGQESTIVAVDFFEWLLRDKPTIATVTNYRVDQILGLILDAVGWTDPAQRDLDESTTVIPSWSADGSEYALSLIDELLTIDMGAFVMSASGRATYRNRRIRYLNGAVAATLTGSMVTGLRSGIGKDDIVNYQEVTRTGSTTQVASDADSRRQYGYREGGAITSDLLASDGQAQSLANFLVLIQKQPPSPVRNVSMIAADEARLLQQLGREVGDLVTLTEGTGGTNLTGRIAAIDHELTDGFTVHRTHLVIEKMNVTAFEIGVGTIGGPAVIAY